MSYITPVTHEYVIDISSNNNFMFIPAVQGDGNNVRYVSVTLISNGLPYTIPSNTRAIVAGDKPDGTHIYNEATIEDNKIIFEITYQMVTVPGKVNLQVGIIDAITESQLKSFPFYLIVTESFDAESIVSSDEFELLIKAIKAAETSYDDIMTHVGRCESASEAANNSATSASNSANAASNSATTATAAATTATNAATDAANSEAIATAKASDAANSATDAANSATASADSAKLSESWAVGHTGIRVGEDTNNSKYWAERAQDWGNHDASNLTYTLDDGTQVNLATFLHIIEELDGETLLLL